MLDDLMANAVHSSEAPDKHDDLCSTLMVNPVHWPANAVHSSEAADVHDGNCSTPVGKYSTPSEAPDVLYMISLQYTLWQMQYTQVGLLKYSMASSVHSMANVVLMANAMHLSEVPDVHNGLFSTLDGKFTAPASNCSTPKQGSWCT